MTAAEPPAVSKVEPLILLIEDELPVHKFLRASLPAHGFRLLGAETGKDGQACAADYNPDVILLDLGLPDMDGLYVLGLLGGKGGRNDPPPLMLLLLFLPRLLISSVPLL
jgi:DNA-binding response OmpR family regulator